MSNYKNKPVILAGLTALLLLAASCTADAPIVFEEHAWKTSWPHKPTISQESKDAQQMKQMISDNTRERMLKNLIEQYKLIGMSKEECMKLLGPEDTECRSGRAFRTGCELCYTGPKRV